jgi:hypothetical protein
MHLWITPVVVGGWPMAAMEKKRQDMKTNAIFRMT